MIYRCDQCGTVLASGMTACPRCGKTYDHPVPADAEAGVPTPTALYTAPEVYRAPGSSRGPWPVLLGVLAVLVIFGLLLWGGYTAWMHGPGGEIVFREANQAGNAAVERRDYEAANAEYTRMIDVRPNKVDGYTLRAISEFKAGQYAEAIADDTSALDRSPAAYDRGLMLYNRAEARANWGRFGPALADYQQSTDELKKTQDPQEKQEVPGLIADNLRAMTWTYLQKKDYRNAIATTTSLIAQGDQQSGDYRMRAQAEDSLGEFSAEEHDFTQMLAVDPTNISGYELFGKILDRQRQYAKALAVFAQGTQAQPGSAMLWGSRGWFAYKSGDLKQAIADDLHEESLDPNQNWVKTNLGLAYAVSGDRDKALAVYADALPHLTSADRKGGISDLQDAHAAHPGVAVVSQSLQMLTTGNIPTGVNLHALPHPASTSVAAVPTDSTFSSALGPEVMLDGYGLRVPQGYQMTSQPTDSMDGQGIDYIWNGPVQSDQITPDIEIMISHDDGGQAAHETSVMAMKNEMSPVAADHSQYSQSAITLCKINGLPFARCDWSGVGNRTGLLFKGFEYVSVTPGHYIRIEGHDSQPSARAILPLLRAAVQTFRQR